MTTTEVATVPPETDPDSPDRIPGHGDRTASEYRFRAIEQHLDDVSETLRVLAPIVRQVGNVEADVEHALAAVGDIKQEMRDLKGMTRDLEKGMTDVIRSSRTDNLKLIAVVTGSFTTIAVVIIGAFAKGLVG